MKPHLPPPRKKGKAPRKTPTFKEKLFAKKYIEFKGNGSKAAIASYDTKPSQGSNMANQLLKKPIVQESISQLLNKAGLDLETLNGYSKRVIDTNMNGKPSQAVAASMIQFAYKLQNAIPAKQSVQVSFSRRESLTVKTFDESKKDLETQTEANQKLLQDLNS